MAYELLRSSNYGNCATNADDAHSTTTFSQSSPVKHHMILLEVQSFLGLEETHI